MTSHLILNTSSLKTLATVPSRPSHCSVCRGAVLAFLAEGLERPMHGCHSNRVLMCSLGRCKKLEHGSGPCSVGLLFCMRLSPLTIPIPASLHPQRAKVRGVAQLVPAP